MNKELESVIESRVKPIVDKAMQDYLGVTISEIKSDITDRLRKKPLLDFEIDTSVPFKKAKKTFKKVYLTKLLHRHLGNISEVAKITGVDRRSVHRLLIELKIAISKFREEIVSSEYASQNAVKGIIEETLENYKNSINPRKYVSFYRHVPDVSRNIVKELPEHPLTLKDAEKEFEKEYLQKALKENNNNISRTARKIGLRFETLHRKLKSLAE